MQLIKKIPITFTTTQFSKLPREYFSLWVINRSLYGNTNTSTFPVGTSKKSRDKSVHKITKHD